MLAPLLPAGESAECMLEGAAGKGRVACCAGLYGLGVRPSGCPREFWPLPQAGSPGCGGLREPPARLYIVGSKNSWILYPSCVLAVPSKCQGRVLAALAAPDSSYLSVCSLGCKALFGWAGCSPKPSPQTTRQQPSPTSYLARAEVVPQAKEGPERSQGLWSCTNRKAP